MAWYERLRVWKEATDERLKKRWWLWPVFFAAELVWHQICESTNHFLELQGMPVIARVLGIIPSDPATLAVMTGVLILVTLAVHAYFDTRSPVMHKMPDHGRPHQAAVPMKAGVRIESADYGSGQHRVDVTKRVRAMQIDPKCALPDGGVGLPVTNDALLDGAADPHYGVVKHLEVRFSQVAHENTVLILPHVSP